MTILAHEPLMNAPFRVSSTSAAYPVLTLKLYLPRRDPRGLGAQGRRALFRLGPSPTHRCMAQSPPPASRLQALRKLRARGSVRRLGKSAPAGARPLRGWV